MRAIATLTFFFLCLGNTIFILVIGLIWIGSASESLKGASIKLIFDYVYNCMWPILWVSVHCILCHRYQLIAS